MPTKDQVLSSYGALKDYRAVARAYGIPAGRAYLIATGLPADGGDGRPPDGRDRPGVLGASTQHLVYGAARIENRTTKGHVHDWVKERTAADAPMQRAAAQQRDAAPGAMEDPQDTEITTVLTREHDRVVALMKQLKAIPGVTAGGSPTHLSRRKSVADTVAVALLQHEAAEQEEFWPAVRHLVPDGGAVADAARSQEQAGTDLLRRLAQLEPSDQRFDQAVMELDRASRKHIALEDKVLLTLAARVSEDVRRELGLNFAIARRRAPTSPGPHAPVAPVAPTEEAP